MITEEWEALSQWRGHLLTLPANGYGKSLEYAGAEGSIPREEKKKHQPHCPPSSSSSFKKKKVVLRSSLIAFLRVIEV